MNDTLSQFGQLQLRLSEMYERVFPDPMAHRTIVVIPSLSFDREELAKIEGADHYEERMLCLLMLLQMPRTNLIYITSQPISPTVIDYFLHLLPGIPSIHARRRLKLFNCNDASNLALTQKILNRPRLIRKIRDAITKPESAHISCFNSTRLEQELALKLDIPLYATDPEHSYLGSKSGGRQIFRDLGIATPPGVENLTDTEEIFGGLATLKQNHPELRHAVVKLNEGFSGEGNAIFSFADCPESDLFEWVKRTLPERLEFEAKNETWAHFQSKFHELGGIVEAFVEGHEKRSPSVQCRINPLGEVEVISTHDQILGGPHGQVYIGCMFPANPQYRLEIQEAGRRVGEAMRDRGVIGRFGVDFISTKQNCDWVKVGNEMNLLKGGTTHTFMMLQFLTNGHYDLESGEFVVPGGAPRCYIASDNIQDDAYRGLGPDDLIDIAVENDLHFHSTIQQGVVFHLIGALSEFGKFGAVCIGDTPDNAMKFYHQTLAALNHST